ncbi:MAG: HYR domain-containing protein [Bacteroidota bacterium]
MKFNFTSKMFKNLAFTAILFIVISTFSERVFASHDKGGFISYTHVSGNTYHVTVTYFRDCGGIGAPGSIAVNAESVSCGFGPTSTNLLLTGSLNTTPLCPADLLNSNCNGGPFEGEEMYFYEADITLAGTCDDWVFSYTDCCLPASVTNVAPNGMYFASNLDNLNIPFNNSPVLTSPSLGFICNGLTSSFNFGAVDIDGDSLSYELVTALDAGPTPMTYNFPYSGTDPMASTPPVFIDAVTGDMVFNPTAIMGAVIAVRIYEFRNGVLIASHLRQMIVESEGCTNNQPNFTPLFNLTGGVQTGPFALEVCPGTPISFDIQASDLDALNVIGLSAVSTYPGSTFTQTGSNPVTGTFSWTPGLGFIGSNIVVLSASDDNCPYLGRDYQSVILNVIQTTSAGPDLIYCPSQGPLTLSAVGGTTFTWSVISGDPALSCTNCSSTIVSPTVTTTYEVTSDLGTCSNTDQVTVTVVPDFTFTISPDTSLCLPYLGTVALNLTTTPTPAGIYTYSWDEVGVSPWTSNIQSPTFTASQSASIALEITSAAGCVLNDTVSITTISFDDNPDWSLSSTASGLCAPIPVDLSATVSYGATCDQYSVSNIPFAPIASAGTSVILFDDQLSSTLPIGFNFDFYCNTYTDFRISSNGYITFDAITGANGCCQGGIIPTNDGINNLIAFSWNDLYPPGAGSITYETVGVSPNRQLLVNFNGIPHCCGGAPPYNTGQIILYESSNNIEIHSTEVSDDGSIHTQGIENEDGTIGVFTPGLNATNGLLANQAYRFVNSGLEPYLLSWQEPLGIEIGITNPITVTPVTNTTYFAVLSDVSGTCISDTLSIDVLSITDALAPVPDILILSDLTDECSVNPSVPTATDNCLGVINGTTLTTFPITTQGTTIVTWSYDDGNGNITTQTQNVIIDDNTLPTITCPADISTSGTSAAGAVVTYTAPIGADNCAGVSTSQTAGLASGATFPIGTTTNSFLVTDISGNTANCSFTITVTGVPPSIVCPVNITTNNDPGNCDAIVNFAATETVGIPASVITYSQNPGTVFPLGTTTVTATATNPLGTSVCTFDITVVDNEDPIALCQNVTVNLDASGNGSITPAMVNNGSTDNCGIASLSLSQTAFTCASTLTNPNTVTLTVTDVNGNASTCTSDITVNDFIAPTAMCQDITVNLDAAGSATVLPSAIDNLSSDACGIASLQINGAASQVYSCANIGANAAILTVTDNNSNVSTCNATVTVVDVTPPTAICQNITVPLNAGGNASVTVAMINNGSNDACGLSGLSVAPNNFTCANLGANAVVLTVIDNNGLSSTCNSTVTIIDNINPVANCQNVTLNLNAAGTATLTAAMVNNVSTDNCTIASLSLSQTAFTCANVGANSVTLTVLDATGNSANCVASISVVDITSPTAICQNISVGLDAVGNASVLASAIDNLSADACGIAGILINGAASQNYTCANIGNNTATLTVTDLSGNTSTCTANVTVQDAIAPTATCQNFTVALDASGNAAITAANINNGSTDNCSIASMSVSPSTFTCANVGANIVTLTVTDVAGNVSTCPSTVTVQDISIPVVSCPGNITQNAVLNNCGKIVSYTMGVTDNCSTVTQTDGTGLTSGSLFPVGVTNQSYTITDAGGNTVNCSFTVTIVDVQDPVITGCPGNIVVSNTLNACNANVFWTAPTASDNCSGVVLTTSHLPGSNFAVGASTTVTYTATDASGRTATCSFTVTVNDTQLPTITCPAPIAVNTDPGFCFATIASLGTPTTNDNCGVASVSNNAPVNFPVGTTAVLWTVTDVHGNAQTCTQNITVTDNIAPVAICQPTFDLFLDVTGVATLTTADINNGSNDACGIASLALDNTAFACSDIAGNPNTVTLTVTDVNGNVSTCTSDVTVIDNIAPVAVCQPTFDIYLDVTGVATLTTGDINNGSNDACGIASLALDNTAFACSDIVGNPNTVTLTVTDVNGNASTCTSDVTVIDNIAPVAVCQPTFDIYLDVTGVATLTTADINNGSNDACGIASLALDNTAFACSDIAGNPNTVTLTVTDVNGNVSTCTSDVTVIDNIAPVAICQPTFDLFLDVTGVATLTTADINNGSNDACGIASLALDNTAFACSDIAGNPNTVTLTVTDVNGNVSTCTSDVTVIDNIAPVAVCQDISISLDGFGLASIVAADIDGGSSDACGFVLSASNTAFDCSNVGTNNITLTVTDPSLNASTCIAVVTVIDPIAPVAVCQPTFDLFLDVTGVATLTTADINNGSADACGIASLALDNTAFACSDIAGNPNTVTLTVTDVNGNVSTCTSDVTVIDNIAPVAICQPTFDLFLDVTGVATLTTADINNGSNDACGIASLALDNTAFACSDIAGNPNTVTLTVTDVNGNVSTCTSDVTVIDNIAPVAVCQPTFDIYLDVTGVATLTTGDINNGSNDACGIASLALDNTAFACSDIVGNPNTVTLIVTDLNGNASTCTSDVTVIDNIAPVAVCQPTFDLFLDVTGVATLTTGDINNGSNDACGIASLALDNTAFACSDIAGNPNTVTLTVTDVNGNVSTCTSDVTVIDNIAPVAVCQPTFDIYLDVTGVATLTTGDINNGSNDACGIASLALDNTAFACSDIAGNPNTVTLTVTDVNGNVSTCTSDVTVIDNIAPVAVCQDISISLDGFGLASIVAADIDGGSSDACGFVLSASNTAFDCSNVGTNNITLTVTDPSLNASTCIAVVTVIDPIAPVITCPGNVLVSNDPGLCSASSVAYGTATAVDNCTSVTITNDAPMVFPFGPTNVTWTATDVYGNTATCIQIVTVEDVEDPTITCPANISVSADAGVCSNSTLVLATPSTVDNCAVATVTNDAPVTYPLGVTMVTWTVTDVQGNSATCSQFITVVDTEAPSITCPSNITVPALFGSCNAIGVVLGTPATSDNCSVASVTNNGPISYPLGTTIVTWTVTDAAGSTSTCTQTVTVIDTQVPTITCPANITVSSDAGTCIATGVVLVAPLTADNCSVASVTNNAPVNFSLGTTTVLWTVTDGAGNTATCSQTVTVTDNELPTITCPANVTAFADAGSCVASGVALGTPVANDNCSVATVINNAPVAFPLGMTTVTWTVTDGSGNVATCTQTVTVSDNEMPMITCPSMVTVSADAGICSASSVVLGTPVTSDNCSVASVTNNAPMTFPLGNTTVTWTVVDGSGNTATCAQTVTVTDNELPTITCPATVIVPADFGTCTAIGVTLGTPVTADNCTVASVTNNAPAIFPLGNTTVTWTVVDGSGNSASCVQVVTVMDTQMPTIICPATVIVSSDLGLCTASGVALGVPLTADNCTVASVTNNAPVIFPLGNTTVTWSVTDGSGNMSTCTQLVTVTDNQAPIVTCPAAIIVPADAGMCSATAVALGSPTVADNCSIASVVNNAPVTYPLGVTTVIWTVTDGSGNQTFCTQFVTVVDNQMPTITCPASFTVSADAGSCVATSVVLGTPTTTDNCTVASVTNNAPAVYPLGNTTVTWTVTDGAGNTASCAQVVTVVDTELPTIACPANLSVPSNAGTCVATGVVIGTPVASDNCTVVSVTNNAPTTFPLGATSITWTVTDGAGNTATCVQIVTVIDTQAPTIACPSNVTVSTTGGTCTATSVALGTPVTADNCSIASITNNAPSVYALGATNVVWTVVDGSGNVATCTQTVTVVDNQNPIIACPAPMTVNTNTACTATGVALGTPVTSDNCTVASVTNNAPVAFTLGTTVVTWTVTDISGNSATCVQPITVVDIELPTITCPIAVTVPASAGQCTATAVALGTPTTADNCSVASVSNNAPVVYPLGVTTVTWTVVDGSGNLATCTQTVTVVDTQLPTIACPANMTVPADLGTCGTTGLALGTPVTTDNCTVASVTNNAPATFPLGTTTVTWTVLDGSGNTATCTQTVTVVDTQAPSIICAGPMTVNNDPGVCSATMTLAVPATADNCSVASITSNAPATFPLGTTTVTWTVVDGSGNSTMCAQTVTVVDNELPTIVCAADINLNNTPGFCGRSVTYAVPAHSDNCSIASFTQTDGSGYVSGDLFPIGTTYQEFTVVDGSGNSFTCGFNITIVDNEMPVIANCPSNIVANTIKANDCSAVASWQAPTFSDNCPGLIVTQSHFSGESFAIGTTTVTYTLADNAGNMVSCSFDVTVNDLVNPVATTSIGGNTISVDNANADSYQWFDCSTGTPIAGANGPTFSPIANGNYGVIVTVGGCADTSNCQSTTTVGVDEVDFADVVLYPNPSLNGSFQINYEGQIEAIMVYDMTGRAVGVDVDLMNKSVNGSSLASGKYLVQIVTESKLITKELVVIQGY